MLTYGARMISKSSEGLNNDAEPSANADDPMKRICIGFFIDCRASFYHVEHMSTNAILTRKPLPDSTKPADLENKIW